MATDPYAPVWREALPYLRARKNDVHVPLSYGYAERLLEESPGANRDVVLLGILLHDVGWALVDQDLIFVEGFGPGGMQSDIRIAHEKLGAGLAREILEGLGYPEETIEPVVAIVDGHDTRPHAISHEDELVKDADKLWRFTVTGVSVSSDWFGLTPDSYVERLERDVIPQLFTPAALATARADLEQTRRLLRLDVLSSSLSATDVYDRIYAAAEPYWSTRSNHVHVPEAYAICKQFLTSFPEADEAVVLPAILLHDVGYFEVPEDDHMKGLAGAPVGWDPDITRRHEVAGARIATEILRGVGYDVEKTRHIVEIVDGHDSRLEPVSVEDAIVKDADKLWRFTENGVRISSGWMERSHDDFLDYVESKIDDWMLTEPGRDLAREILGRTRASLLV